MNNAQIYGGRIIEFPNLLNTVISVVHEVLYDVVSPMNLRSEFVKRLNYLPHTDVEPHPCDHLTMIYEPRIRLRVCEPVRRLVPEATSRLYERWL